MSWAAHALRVPPDWDEDAFDPDQGHPPEWPKDKCTHWQFWQNKADVTPVSPVFATSADLADYAMSHVHEAWFEWGRYLTHEAWISSIQDDVL